MCMGIHYGCPLYPQLLLFVLSHLPYICNNNGICKVKICETKEYNLELQGIHQKCWKMRFYVWNTEGQLSSSKQAYANKGLNMNTSQQLKLKRRFAFSPITCIKAVIIRHKRGFQS
jgi:hypothetical protein